MKHRLATVLIAAVAGGGCITTKTVSLQRKTQLENQILGTLARLDDALVLASSVRGEARAPGLSPLARQAAEAAMTRAFIADDIDDLRTRRVAGEGRDGLLVIVAPPGDPRAAARARALLADENRARRVIMRRAIDLSPDLGPRDLPLVRRIFHRLVRRSMRPGQLVEGEDGRFLPLGAPPAAAPAGDGGGGGR